MQHSFLKPDFCGFVLSLDDRQHFVFNSKGVLVGVVILGDLTYGIGLEKLKDLVWCHEYIVRDATKNLLDFSIDNDSSELWSEIWLNFEDLTAVHWLSLVKYC
jgi:hypothetical protein